MLSELRTYLLNSPALYNGCEPLRASPVELRLDDALSVSLALLAQAD